MIHVTQVSTMLTSSPAKSLDTACPGAAFSSLYYSKRGRGKHFGARGGEACTELQNEKQAKSTENFLYLHAVVMCI